MLGPMSARAKATPLVFAGVAGWRRWLAKNWGQENGEWLLVAKKGTTRGVHYAEALEEALCWGWIDAQLRPHDSTSFALWFCPRRPGSIWSAANRATALRLLREGRMRESGLARIREAKAGGRWASAYSAAAPPALSADIRAGLVAAGALGAFRGLSASRRLQLLSWVSEAKRPETRTRRIAALPLLVGDPGTPRVRPRAARPRPGGSAATPRGGGGRTSKRPAR